MIELVNDERLEGNKKEKETSMLSYLKSIIRN